MAKQNKILRAGYLFGYFLIYHYLVIIYNSYFSFNDKFPISYRSFEKGSLLYSNINNKFYFLYKFYVYIDN